MAAEKQTAMLPLPLTAVDSLIGSGDGDAALLYLYLCRTGSVLRLQEAARAIGRTEADTAAAVTKLRALGIFPGSAEVLPQPEELPEYAPEEIARRCGEDPVFKSLIGEAQCRLGHMLGTAEMRTLYGIYDHLGLPPEVIMLLINHCAEQCRKKYGEGRRPTMRSIEREAFGWAGRELLTLELAEEYLDRQNRREQGLQQVRSLLGLCDRALSRSERQYIEGWLEQGFSAEVIYMAYDRTVINTGSLKWRYMDSILQSWRGRGLFRPEDIERLDSRRSPKQTERATGGEQEEMERLLSRLRDGQ